MSTRADRGQALVEFALIIPILLILLIAIFDVGRLVFAYNDITNSARSGVRVAIVNQGGTVARDATINQASLGLQPSDVTITYLNSAADAACGNPYKVGCLARVTVRFPWSSITPIIGSILGPITVTTSTTMPIEPVFP